MSANGAFACEQVPAGQTFRIRLLQPVASYSSLPGTALRGFIIESPVCEGSRALPIGTLIEGHIVSVRKVGLGFRHETAALQIEFDRVIQNDVPVAIRARVVAVDNAREKVKDGVIRGARSTKSPHGVVGNTLGYILMWHPASFWMVPVQRAAFSVFPEPELYFPSGTDLLLQLSAPMPVVEGEITGPNHCEFTPFDRYDFDQRISSFPERSSTPQGGKADVVNLAFVGSQDQIERAFEAAGWLSSDANSVRHSFHQYSAFVLWRNYPRSPMSQQLLEGKASEFSWEKGLDSVARRDHLRVWSDANTWQGRGVWLAASTQDIGIHLLLRDTKFTHRVEPEIDVERERIVRDLSVAGCVESVYRAARPGMPASMVNATGEKLQTDGAIAIVRLKDCEAPVFADHPRILPLPARPASKLARYVRTQVLSFRDLWRENAAYNAFDLSRTAARSWRRNHDPIRHAQAVLSEKYFN